MLSGLVAFSARHRGVVFGLAVALLAAGVNALTRAKLDIFPEFAPPQVSIQTEAPGLSPEQVELLVTKPIEDAINGVEGIVMVRSQSIQGLSVITAILGERIEIHRARQSVAERLTEVQGRLPLGIRAPVLSPLTSSSSTVLVVGLTSTTRTSMEIRTFADRVLKPQILATPGVAKVALFGGEVRQLQIRLDPDRLRRHGLTVADVVEAASRATGVRGAGVLDGPNQRIVVRTEGQRADPASLAETAIRAVNGVPLRLGDVASVVSGPEPMVGEGAVNGVRGVVAVVSAQLGGNTKVVGGDVEAALARMAPAIMSAGLTLQPSLFRPSEFIDIALDNLTTSLLLGAVLVSVVLFVFLADASAAFISLTAIPLSLLAAVLVISALGYSLNTLTLGGLAIALGEVVDDAIIDVENIARRLRDNRAAGSPLSAVRVVIDASLEVRSSVVYATFVVALVFLPVVALSGVQGALFRPLALSYILATLASLVVALTVTPALTLLLLGRTHRRDRPPVVLAWLTERYRRVLVGLLDRPVPVLSGAGLLCVGAVACLPLFGTTFLPEFREGHFVIHMSAVPGTSLQESLRIGQQVTAALRTDPRVRSVAQRIGRAELSEDTWGTHYTELEVDLVPLSGKDALEIREDLRRTVDRFPGVSFAIRGFLGERIEETLTGSTAEVVVRVVGDDLDSLDVAARRVAVAVRAVPGATDVQYEPPPVTPQLLIRIKPESARRLGLRNDDVLAAVEVASKGAVVGQVFEGSRPVDVVVILDTLFRQTPAALGRLPLRAPDGRLVRLADVATFALTSGRYVIAHQGTRRVQIVSANVRGRDLGGFSAEIEALMRDQVALPIGIFADVGGSGTAQREARRELLFNSSLAALGILLLLGLAFGDVRRVGLVAANVPFALVGGVLAAAVTGATLSLGSLVGFVTLFGIATRNAVMLVSHYDHLVRVEGATWSQGTAVRGALERLGPILMTALVTAIALLPLAIGSGDPGREIEGPMAIVILGGLLSSTVLSLFVLPVLAHRLGRFGDLGPLRD
jgi:CzcA family heavy metal efflux pump